MLSLSCSLSPQGVVGRGVTRQKNQKMLLPGRWVTFGEDKRNQDEGKRSVTHQKRRKT